MTKPFAATYMPTELGAMRKRHVAELQQLLGRAHARATTGQLSAQEFSACLRHATRGGYATPAALGKATGISVSTISRWAAGRGQPHALMYGGVLLALMDCVAEQHAADYGAPKVRPVDTGVAGHVVRA